MTISVKNSAGANTTISTIDDLLPVIATSALQTTGNTSLAAILAKIVAAPSTEAKQDTGNTSLASILAKLPATPPTEAKQDAANASLVSILAKIIAAPATEAKQDTINTSVNSIKTGTVLAAGENRIGSVGGITSYIDVTAVLDTSAYAAGDVLVATQAIPNALRVNDGTGILQSIAVIDQDDNKADFKIIFLNADVSMGAANAVPSITDANAVNILGAPVAVAALDYTDLGGVSIAGRDGIGKVVKAATGTRNVYFAIINGDTTPTYSAAGIKLRFGFLLD